MSRPVRFAAMLAAACLTLSAGRMPAAEAADKPVATKLRVAVLTGGHGYDKKAFPQVFKGHADLACELRERKKGQPSVFADVADWPYDVMVLYNFNQRLSEPERANFLKLLDKGVALVVLHHAIAAYPSWPDWEKIIGAKYYLKPTEVDGVPHGRSVWKHGVDMKIHVADPDHPITKGLKDFVAHDETYGKWTYFPGSHLLLSTDNPLNEKQIAWAKTYRKARVVFFQLGHGPEAFDPSAP